LEPVIRSWELSVKFHRLNQPASDDAIELAEAELERKLPSALRAIYEMSDGAELLEGNLQVEPLGIPAPKSGIVTLGDELRDAQWPIPPELLVFGGDGQGDQLGCWLPEGIETLDPPVVLLGQVFEPKCLAVMSLGVVSFFKGWTAYYLQVIEAPDEAQDALGTPSFLQSTDPDEELLYRCLAWASPDLPDPRPDPYTRGLSAEELASLL
jgi:hypothetical protein